MPEDEQHRTVSQHRSERPVHLAQVVVGRACGPEPADPAAGESRHPCEPGNASRERPAERLGDDERSDPVVQARAIPRRDRPAQVVHDQGDVAEGQCADERSEDPREGTEVERFALGDPRRAGAQNVQSNAAEPFAETDDHVAPWERPRSRMDEQERRPLTLVDVVDRAALDLDRRPSRGTTSNATRSGNAPRLGGARARLHRRATSSSVSSQASFSLHPTRRDTGRRRDSFDPIQKRCLDGCHRGRAVSS